jgi:hypothetical protein
MAVDPNIIFQLGKGVTPLLSPAEIQNQQLEREAGTYKLNALRQSAQDDAAYRDVLKSGASPEMIPNKLFQAGLGKQGQEWQKFQTDQQKTQADTQKAKLEAGIKQFDAIGQIMSGVRDQATYDLARQQVAGIVGPEAMANIPAVYDPATVARNQQQAMSVKDQMEQARKRYEFDNPSANTILQSQTSQANNAATIANSRRTADMTDARSREANMNGRVPSGYRQAADGALEFIPGGPADPASKAGGGKPLTEGQSKALLFGTRMKEANEILEGLASKGVDRPGYLKRAADAVPNVMGGGLLQTGANAVQSAEQQQVEQAQRDFLNAVLRRESGAVIADSEFENGRKQYFPAIGDSDAVKAQKKRNRDVAMRGILEEVPDGDSRVAKVRGASSGSGSPMKVTNAADYAKVPSGATYTTPDGKLRRKP